MNENNVQIILRVMLDFQPKLLPKSAWGTQKAEE